MALLADFASVPASRFFPRVPTLTSLSDGPEPVSTNPSFSPVLARQLESSLGQKLIPEQSRTETEPCCDRPAVVAFVLSHGLRGVAGEDGEF